LAQEWRQGVVLEPSEKTSLTRNENVIDPVLGSLRRDASSSQAQLPGRGAPSRYGRRRFLRERLWNYWPGLA